MDSFPGANPPPVDSLESGDPDSHSNLLEKGLEASSAAPPSPPPWWGSWREEGVQLAVEVKKTLGIGLPMVLNTVIDIYALSFSILVVCGRLGEREFAAVSLATTFINVTGWSLAVGLSEGIDTLCSQAYGAKQWAKCGEVFQQALVVLFGGAMVSTCIWLMGGNILLLAGQPPDLVRLASQYCLILIPALWAFVGTISIQAFLSAMGHTSQFVLTGFCTLLFHLTGLYFFVYYLQLGFQGAAIAWLCTNFWRCGMMVIVLLRCSDARRCFRECGGLSIATAFSWREIKEYLSLAVPAYTMLGLEWITFEIATILAGLLPEPTVAVSALTIVESLSGILFMLPLGLGIGVTARVGQAVGAGKPKEAKLASIGGLLFFVATYGPIAVLLSSSFVRRHLATAFISSPEGGGGADDDEVEEGEEEDWEQINYLVTRGVPILLAAQFFDGTKELLNGILRGLGLQRWGVITACISYSLVMLPSCAAFAFKFHQHLFPGVIGLLVGFCLGSFTHCLLNTFVVLRYADFSATALESLVQAKDEKTGATGEWGDDKEAEAPLAHFVVECDDEEEGPELLNEGAKPMEKGRDGSSSKASISLQVYQLPTHQ